MSIGLDLILLLAPITRMDIKNLNKGQVNNCIDQLESWEYAFIFLLFARLSKDESPKRGLKSPEGLEYLNLMKSIQKKRLHYSFGIRPHYSIAGPNLDALEVDSDHLRRTKGRIDFEVNELKRGDIDLDTGEFSHRGIIWDNVKCCLGEDEIIKRINAKAKDEGCKGIDKQEKIGKGVRFNSDMILVNGIREESQLCWVPMWQRKNIKFEFDTYYDKCDIEISVIDWIFEDVLYEFCDDYMGEGHFSNNEDKLDWFKNRVNDVKSLQEKLISSLQELQMIKLARKYRVIHHGYPYEVAE